MWPSQKGTWKLVDTETKSTTTDSTSESKANREGGREEVNSG